MLTGKHAAHLRQIHDAARERGISSAAYLSAMFTGSVEEQMQRVAAPGAELTYVAVLLFGPAEALRELTKRTNLLD